MSNLISRGRWTCLGYFGLIACLVLQPLGTLANANKSALAPSSDFAGGHGPDYPALIHQFQILDEALHHGLFRRLGKDQPAAMNVLRMYCMVLVARNAHGPLRDEILGYFKFRKWITESQKRALARAADAAPHKALQELCKHQKDAALADAEKIYAFWLKRGMAASDFTDVYAQELTRALDENLLTLKYGKNALPLEVFMVIHPRREEEFLNAVSLQHDDWFVQSYASAEARSAARRDIASAESKARFREKGPIEGYHYADHVAAMEAELLLPYLFPAPERAHVLAMGPQAGALLRQWIRANPEKAGRRVAFLANKRAALKARELMPKKVFPTMEFHHGQENPPPFRAEASVSLILVKGYFQDLHARGDRGAILEAIAQIDRDLAVGGTLDILESGNTPVLLHKLLSAAGYELIQKRHVPGIVSPDGYTLLSFEKIHSKGKSFLHSMRYFPDDHWPAYFAPDYSDPADLPGVRNAMSRQVAELPDPEHVSYPYSFPKNIGCSVRQALLYHSTQESFSLHGLVSVSDIHGLMNEKDLRAYLYAQDDETREKIIKEIDHVLSYLDMGPGRTSRSLLRAWNLHDAVQSIIGKDGSACRELLRALEESLGRDGLLKFREDFQTMHGATAGRLNFAVKLMQTYLIEKYVNGGRVWLLPASHASAKIAAEVERRRYPLPKDVQALLEKHAGKWRSEVFRHLVTDPVARRDLLWNLGIRDADILKAKAPLPMLLDLYVLQMGDEHYTGPVTRKLLEELSGGPLARLLCEKLKKTRRWGDHEPYLRAYLLHAGGDADLTERFQALIKRHAGRAAQALKAIARDPEENIRIRQFALMQLAKAPPKGMKAFLGQVLAESNDHTLIVHALWAFRDLRLRFERPLAEKISRHPDAWVRQQLARALGEMGVKSSVEILNALSSDANAHVRQAADEALLALQGEQARPGPSKMAFMQVKPPYHDSRSLKDGREIAFHSPSAAKAFGESLITDGRANRLFVAVDGRNIEIIAGNGIGLTAEAMGSLIADAKNRLRQAGRDIRDLPATLVIALLDQSSHLFEDHIANGFIGVNRALNEIADARHRQILLRVGLSHELSHELTGGQGEAFEAAQMLLDAEYVIGLLGAAGISVRQWEETLLDHLDSRVLWGFMNVLFSEEYFGLGAYRWIEDESSRRGDAQTLQETVDRLCGDEVFLAQLESTHDTGRTIVRYCAENNMPLGTKHLMTFTSLLKKKIPQKLRNRSVIIRLPLRSYAGVLVGLQDSRIQSYITGEAYKNLPKEDKLVALIGFIKDQDIPVQSEHLGHIHSALPAVLAPGVQKRDVQRVDLPMRVFDQVRAALEDKRVQEYLQGEAYEALSAEDKLVELVGYIKDQGIPIQSEHLKQIYSALPAVLAPGVQKRDVQTVNLPMRVFDQVRAALEDKRVQEYLQGEVYEALSAEDKLAELVGYIKDQGIPVQSEHLGQIHSALPAVLAPGVQRRDIQNVNLPMRVFDQVRAALKDKRVQKYLQGKAYEALSAGDKLAELVGYIKHQGIPVQSENLGQIHSALPAVLAPGVQKRDVKNVDLPMRVFDQVRAALKDKRVRKYLQGKAYSALSTGDKLAELVGYIKYQGIPVQREHLGHIHRALPAVLAPGVQKRDVKNVDLPMRVFDQVRAALKDKRVQEYLQGKAYEALSAEDKFAELVGYIKHQGIPVQSENLGQIHSALPAVLAPGVQKRDVQKVNLPMRVFDQVRAALKDKRVRKYLQGKAYEALSAEDKLAELVGYIKDQGIPVQSENLGQIHSALPAVLAPGVQKGDIQYVNLPMRVFDQVREYLRANADLLKPRLTGTEKPTKIEIARIIVGLGAFNMKPETMVRMISDAFVEQISISKNSGGDVAKAEYLKVKGRFYGERSLKDGQELIFRIPDDAKAFGESLITDGRANSFFVALEGRNIEIIAENGIGLTAEAMGSLIADAKNRLRQAGGDIRDLPATLVIALLDQSSHMFEDHMANGFIGVNRALNEIADARHRQILLGVGLSHELSHEWTGGQGEAFEAAQMTSDIACLRDAMQATGVQKDSEEARRMVKDWELLLEKSQEFTRFCSTATAPPALDHRILPTFKDLLKQARFDREKAWQAMEMLYRELSDPARVEEFLWRLYRDRDFYVQNTVVLRELAFLLMGSERSNDAEDVLVYLQSVSRFGEYENGLGKAFVWLRSGQTQRAMERLNKKGMHGPLYGMYSGFMHLQAGGEESRAKAKRSFEQVVALEPAHRHAPRMLALLERSYPAQSVHVAQEPPRVQPAATSSAARIIADYYDPAATDMSLLFYAEMSGHFVLDRSDVPAVAKVDDTPAGVNVAKKDMAAVLNGSMTAYSYGNYLYNDGFVIFEGDSRRLYHRQGEPFSRRMYNMVVTWKDGRISSENVWFDQGPGGSARVLVGGQKEDKTGLIRHAFSGIKLIENARPVALQALHNQFDDLFHLYRLPQFITKEGDRNVYGECMGWKELYVAIPWSGRIVDRALLYKVLRESGYMEMDLRPYWHYGLEKIKEFALATRGYREKTGGGELTEGEYRIDIRGQRLHIKLIKGVYPHNAIGVTRSGRIVMINATGDLSKGVGMTIAQLQQESMRKTAGDGDPVQDLFLLASGPDVIKFKEGRLIPEDSAVGGRLLQSALIAFTPAEESPSRLNVGDQSAKICQSSL